MADPLEFPGDLVGEHRAEAVPEQGEVRPVPGVGQDPRCQLGDGVGDPGERVVQESFLAPRQLDREQRHIRYSQLFPFPEETGATARERQAGENRRLCTHGPSSFFVIHEVS